jgi:subtilisin family serine protease
LSFGLLLNKSPGGSVGGGEITKLQWQGKAVDVRAGEWIVGLTPPKSLVDPTTGQIKSNAVRNYGAAPSAAIKGALRAAEAIGGKFGKYLGSEDVFQITAPLTMGAEQISALLAALPGFRYIEPNGVGRICATPNDTSFTNQYALNNTGQTYKSGTSGTSGADIDAPAAWDYSIGSSSLVVAVLDTGVNGDHVDLAANMWHSPFGSTYPDGYDFVNGDGDPMDDHGHAHRPRASSPPRATTRRESAACRRCPRSFP